MLVPQLLAVTLAFAPSLVSAAIFPSDTTVKMLNAKTFKKAMKQNATSVVAFVAPWCGHCQRMAPEYSRAALGLYPLVPLYAVDCDDTKNKRLCAEQGVKGFPTVKVFPRGSQLPPKEFDGPERTASAFFYWASRAIPQHSKKLFRAEHIEPWVNERLDKPRALLLTKDKKIPLLWQVLGNKYQDQLVLASHRDRKGKTSVLMGYEAGDRDVAKVLLYPAGSTQPFRYEGLNKFDSLSKFFDSVLDGTADLHVVNEEAKKEELVLDEAELEIQRKQEAQRIALAHGGFADLIDFEKAILEGGANYHDSHGYGGMMGAAPKKAAEDTEAPKEAVKTPENSGQAVFQAPTSVPPKDTAEATGTDYTATAWFQPQGSATVHPSDEL